MEHPLPGLATQFSSSPAQSLIFPNPIGPNRNPIGVVICSGRTNQSLVTAAGHSMNQGVWGPGLIRRGDYVGRRGL